ncbi:MAG: recombinase family protein [Acidimicrobiia bacterium]|nr:recombinase family protein [Acidimicrobiia bacterium]
MRLAGYVRQMLGKTDPDTAFAQAERIRRWARDTDNDLVAMFEDPPATVTRGDRPGYRSLLEVVRAGRVDAVVVGSLTALSPDLVTQEIMITDLRRAGATVVATDDHDVTALIGGDGDHVRMVVRDVLTRVLEYRSAFGLADDEIEAGDVSAVSDEDRDVVVRLFASGD